MLGHVLSPLTTGSGTGILWGTGTRSGLCSNNLRHKNNCKILLICAGRKPGKICVRTDSKSVRLRETKYNSRLDHRILYESLSRDLGFNS